MAELLADGKWASAEDHLNEGVARRVPQDELDRWIVLTAITPLPDLAPQSAQLASVRRLLSEEQGVAEAQWLAARWYLEEDPSDASLAVSRLRQIAADPSTNSPLASSLLLDIEANRSVARGDTLAADSLWHRATRYYAVDDLIYGLTASLWPLRLSHAQVTTAMGAHAAAVDIAETFTRLAGFTQQAAWPIVLPLLAESYAATGNPLRTRDIYTRFDELLEEADGDGIVWMEEVRTRLGQLRE